MATPMPTTAAREPIFRHPWRAVIVTAILLSVASLLAVLSDSADTTRLDEQPREAVQRVDPAPGEILTDSITADLRDDLTGVLVIDGYEIPEDQTDRVVPLGQVSFRPEPGKDIVRFQPGTHTVTVRYWERGKTRPANPQGYTWTFRSVS